MLAYFLPTTQFGLPCYNEVAIFLKPTLLSPWDRFWNLPLKNTNGFSFFYIDITYINAIILVYWCGIIVLLLYCLPIFLENILMNLIEVMQYVDWDFFFGCILTLAMFEAMWYMNNWRLVPAWMQISFFSICDIFH